MTSLGERFPRLPILTPEERVGTTLAGKYRLERLLARGGMGTIFAALHEWTERPVAVKLLNYEYARDEETVRRFLQEARAAARLKHPNVVDVLDMGREPDGSVYLVLELLEGQTLKDFLRDHFPVSKDQLLPHILPILDALATAHQAGVVHRDLKPDNIFLALEHGKVTPKLLDFGIAKVLGDDATKTGTGVMIGTPQFMSPEQVRGRDVGPPSDVWAIGSLCYLALSARPAFRGHSSAETLAKVLVERPPPLCSVAPHVSPALGDIVDRCLAARAEDRYRDAAALRRALAAIASEPHSSEPLMASASYELHDSQTLAPQPLVVSRSEPVAWPEPDPSTETPLTWFRTLTSSRPKQFAFVGLAIGVLSVVGLSLIYSAFDQDTAENESGAPTTLPAALSRGDEPPPAPTTETVAASDEGIDSMSATDASVDSTEAESSADEATGTAPPAEPPATAPTSSSPRADERSVSTRRRRRGGVRRQGREPNRGTGGALILR